MYFLENGEDEVIVMLGIVIIIILEKGEIEELEYVFVIMYRNKSSLFFKELEEIRIFSCNCKYCSYLFFG